MCIALARYEFLDLSRSVRAFQRGHCTRLHGICDLVKKVTLLALSILALYGAFILDCVIAPISLIYKRCNPRLANDIQRDKMRLALLEGSPYHRKPRNLDDQTFFEGALVSAFLQFEKSEVVQKYRDDIANHDAAIFQWCAKALLIHYLRSRQHSAEFKDFFPRREELLGDVDQIFNKYAELSPKERAVVCLKLIDPEFSTDDVRKKDLHSLIKAIEGCALKITQNQNYTLHIYSPVQKKVDQL